jgi:hypothetical protein
VRRVATPPGNLYRFQLNVSKAGPRPRLRSMDRESPALRPIRIPPGESPAPAPAVVLLPLRRLLVRVTGIFAFPGRCHKARQGILYRSDRDHREQACGEGRTAHSPGDEPDGQHRACCGGNSSHMYLPGRIHHHRLLQVLDDRIQFGKHQVAQLFRCAPRSHRVRMTDRVG